MSMLTRGVGWGNKGNAARVRSHRSPRFVLRLGSKDVSTDKGDHDDLASLVQIRINLGGISLIVNKVSLGNELSTAIVDST